MAISLKQYAVVGFMSEVEARNALKTTLKQFRNGRIPSTDLSHCECNIVYLHVENSMEKTLIEKYLLNQPGAQPKGCLVKINTF